MSSRRLLIKTLGLMVSADFSDDADDVFDKKEKLRLIESPHFEPLLFSAVLVTAGNMFSSFPASALHEVIDTPPESRGELKDFVAADEELLDEGKIRCICCWRSFGRCCEMVDNVDNLQKQTIQKQEKLPSVLKLTWLSVTKIFVVPIQIFDFGHETGYTHT